MKRKFMTKKESGIQDELISFMLAPMQRKIDQIERENISHAKYKSDVKAGRCVARYGVGCECRDCELNGLAYDLIEFKPASQTALEALQADEAFPNHAAQRWIDIFDDLGIFSDAELYGSSIKNQQIQDL